MVRERYHYSDASMADRLRELEEVNGDLIRETVLICACLMITLHRLEIMDISDDNSEELQELTESVAEKFKEEYEAKQKRLLDEHRRVCGDSLSRFRDASRSNPSKE